MVNESVPSRDGFVNDLERHDLLTGEPRYIEDDIRNSYFSMFFGIGALILMVIATIITWILRSHVPIRTFTWHGIWTILAAVFSLIAIVWACTAAPAIKGGRQPNTILTGFVFLVSLFFVVYLIVESMWLIFYRSIAYEAIIGISTVEAEFRDRFGDIDLEGALQNFRRAIWWVIILSLAGAGCFTFIAYASRSVVWNIYQMTRYGLYWALAFMVLSAWIMIYWAEESFEYEGFLSNDVDSVHKNTRLIKALAITALVVAGVATIINLLKLKLGYFLMGFIFLALMGVSTAAAGYLFRQVRHFQTLDEAITNVSSCAFTMRSIHEDDFIKDFCPISGGKYLPVGQTCGKELLVFRYEGNDPNEIRSLNPVCCLTSKFYFIWPLMQLAYWTLAIAIISGICANFCFYLSDTSEYLTNANKDLGIADILGLLLVAGLLIAWGIYYLARDKSIARDNSTPADQLAAFNNPNRTLNGFQVVPRGLLNETNPITPIVTNTDTTGKTCFSYDQLNMPYPKFSNSSTTCNDPTFCSVRVAISSINAEITSSNPGAAFTPGANTRNNFFPQCANNIVGYTMAYGTIDQVRNYLSSLRFCVTNFTIVPTYAFYKDQVSAATINNNGLTSNETLAFDVDNQNSAQCYSQYPFTKFNNTTIANCNAAATCRISSAATSRVKFRTLKGRLYYIENGQSRYDIHNQLSVTAFSGIYPVGNNEALFENGVFVIRDVPIYDRASYVLTLIIRDTSGVFFDKSVDVKINSLTITQNEIGAGDIRLITRNASICSVNDTLCKANQPLLTGNLTMVVEDGSNAALGSQSIQRVSGANLGVARNHTALGTPFVSTTTNGNGVANVNDLPYSAYTVFATMTGYSPNVRLVDLQEPVQYVRPIVLEPSINDYDAKLTAAFLAPQTDYDLILQVRSDTGSNCEVSPYSKYCAFSVHADDVTNGPGEENIYIRRLTVSTYNAFVRQSPAYNVNCDSFNVIRDSIRHAAAIPWSHVQGTTAIPLQEGSVATEITFRSSVDEDDAREAQVISYPPSSSVESPAQAAVPRRLINFDGTPLYGDNQTLNDTSYVDEDLGQDQNLSNRTNSTFPNQPNVSTNLSNCTDVVNCTTNGTNCTNFSICNFNFSTGNYFCKNLLICANGTNCTSDNTTYLNCTNNTTTPLPPVINNTCDLVDERIIFCTTNSTVAASERGISTVRDYFFILNTDPNTNVTQQINDTVLLNASNETVNVTNTTANGSNFTLNATEINTSTRNPDGSVTWIAAGNSTSTNNTSGCTEVENFTGEGSPDFEGNNMSIINYVDSLTCGANNLTTNTTTIQMTDYVNGTQEITTTSTIVNPDGSVDNIVEFITITPNGTNITNTSSSTINSDQSSNTTTTTSVIVYPNGTVENFNSSSADSDSTDANRSSSTSTNSSTSINGTNVTNATSGVSAINSNGTNSSLLNESTELNYPNGTNETRENITSNDTSENGTNTSSFQEAIEFSYPNGTTYMEGISTTITTTPDNLTTTMILEIQRLTPSSILDEGYFNIRNTTSNIFNGTNDTTIVDQNSTLNRINCVNTTVQTIQRIATNVNQSDLLTTSPIIDVNTTYFFTVVLNDSSNSTLYRALSNETCSYLNNITDYLPFNTKDEAYFRELTTHLIGVNITVDYVSTGASSDELSNDFSSLATDVESYYFNPASSLLNNYTRVEDNSTVNSIGTTIVNETANLNVTDAGVFNNITGYFDDRTEPNSSTTQYTNTTVSENTSIASIRRRTRTGTGANTIVLNDVKDRYNKTDDFFSNISTHDNSTAPVVVQPDTPAGGTTPASFLDFSSASNDSYTTIMWNNITYSDDERNTTVNNSSVYVTSFNFFNMILVNYSNTTNFSNVTIYANGTNITNQTNYSDFRDFSPASNGTYNNSSYINNTNPNGALNVLHSQGVLAPRNFTNVTLNNETNTTNMTDFGFRLNITHNNLTFGSSNINAYFNNITTYNVYEFDNRTADNLFWYSEVYVDQNFSDTFNNTVNRLTSVPSNPANNSSSLNTNSTNGSTLSAQNYSYMEWNRTNASGDLNTTFYENIYNYSNRTFLRNMTLNESEYKSTFYSTNNATLDVVNLTYLGNNTTEYFDQLDNRTNFTTYVSVNQTIGFVGTSTNPTFFNKFQRTVPTFSVANNTVTNRGFLEFNMSNNTTKISPFIALNDSVNSTVGFSILKFGSVIRILNRSNETGIGFNYNESQLNELSENNTTVRYDNQTDSVFSTNSINFTSVNRINQSDFANNGSTYGTLQNITGNGTVTNLPNGVTFATVNSTTITFDGLETVTNIQNKGVRLGSSIPTETQDLIVTTTVSNISPAYSGTSRYELNILPIPDEPGLTIKITNDSTVSLNDERFYQLDYEYFSDITGVETIEDTFNVDKKFGILYQNQINGNTSNQRDTVNFTYRAGLNDSNSTVTSSPEPYRIQESDLELYLSQSDLANSVTRDMNWTIVQYTQYLDQTPVTPGPLASTIMGQVNYYTSNFSFNLTTVRTADRVLKNRSLEYRQTQIIYDNSDELTAGLLMRNEHIINGSYFYNLDSNAVGSTALFLQSAQVFVNVTYEFTTASIAAAASGSTTKPYSVKYITYQVNYTYNTGKSDPTRDGIQEDPARSTVEFVRYSKQLGSQTEAEMYLIRNKTFYNTLSDGSRGTRNTAIGTNGQIVATSPAAITSNTADIDQDLITEIGDDQRLYINVLLAQISSTEMPPSVLFEISQSTVFPVFIFVPQYTVRRRVLMEKPQRHSQGTTVTGGNYIWISCFTGFGEASLISINSVTSTPPSVDSCISRIASEKSNFTVQRLRASVDSYMRSNPGSV